MQWVEVITSMVTLDHPGMQFQIMYHDVTTSLNYNCVYTAIIAGAAALTSYSV